MDVAPPTLLEPAVSSAVTVVTKASAHSWFMSAARSGVLAPSTPEGAGLLLWSLRGCDH